MYPVFPIYFTLVQVLSYKIYTRSPLSTRVRTSEEVDGPALSATFVSFTTALLVSFSDELVVYYELLL